MPLTITILDSAAVELLAGDPAQAAVALGEGFKLAGELGEKSLEVTAAELQAEALYALGQLDEADAWADHAAKLGYERGHAVATGEGEGGRPTRRARRG